MNIPPIPSGLLNDEFTLLVPNGTGYKRTHIEGVRIIEKSAISDYASANVRGLSQITIYYDCAYSYPEDIEFKAGMCAQYKNELWELTEVMLYGVNSPHHYTITARKVSG